jgi:hypothetical protein
LKVEVFLDGGTDWSAWIQAAATTIALAIAIWQMIEAEKRNAQQRYATSHAAYSLARSAHQTLVPIVSELFPASRAAQPAIAQRILRDGHIASTIQALTSFDASRLPTEMLVSRFLLAAENTIGFQTALQQIAVGGATPFVTYDEYFTLVQRAASDMVQPLLEQSPGYRWRARKDRLSKLFRWKAAKA